MPTQRQCRERLFEMTFAYYNICYYVDYIDAYRPVVYNILLCRRCVYLYLYYYTMRTLFWIKNIYFLLLFYRSLQMI